MIDYAGIAVFVFGNKRSAASIVPSDGMREEFDLCIAAGVKPLPIGATGFLAELFGRKSRLTSRGFSLARAQISKAIQGTRRRFATAR